MRHFAVSLIVHRKKIERLSASNILAADEADRSGDLRTTIEYASGARHTIRLWNEFRVCTVRHTQIDHWRPSLSPPPLPHTSRN